MKILMLSSEMEPFASAGSMGTSVGQLSEALAKAGHEVAVVMPLYRRVKEGFNPKKSRIKFPVTVGQARYSCQIFESRTAQGVRVFFLGRDEFFDRSGLYGNDSGDYQDNAARFIFFVRAALEFAVKSNFEPEVIHAHGWQAALAGAFLRNAGSPVPVVLTPHGLEFQGNFWSYDFGLTNLPNEYFSSTGLEFYGSMNFLKTGFLFSRAIILPDERTAAMAQTPVAGCGLENVLREQFAKVHGIPDGSAIEGWDPRTDETLVSGFDLNSLARRKANAAALKTRFGWSDDAFTFVVLGEVSHSVPSLFDALDRLLSNSTCMLFLRSADEEKCPALEVARRRHAPHFACLDQVDEVEARQILAGADFLLVPDQVLSAQPWLPRALRYGLVPVARQAPGLGQFVQEAGDLGGNGFLFWTDVPDAMVDGCRKALGSVDQLNQLRKASMQRCFSLSAGVSAHEELYSSL